MQTGELVVALQLVLSLCNSFVASTTSLWYRLYRGRGFGNVLHSFSFHLPSAISPCYKYDSTVHYRSISKLNVDQRVFDESQGKATYTLSKMNDVMLWSHGN